MDGARAENLRLGRFHEPIAIIAPEEIVKPLPDNIELVFAIPRVERVDRFVQSGEDFDRVDRQQLIVDFRIGRAGAMHLAKTRRIPKLGREIASLFDLLFIEANVLAARRDTHETEAQTVRAVLVDQIERIGRVA